MNSSLILPNITTPYQAIDCSGLTVQLCDSLSSNVDMAVIVIGVGILLQFIRKMKHNDPLSNYLYDSILPELMIWMGFGLLFFVRFLSG